MDPSAILKGIVVSADGKPVAQARLTVTGTRKNVGDPPFLEGTVETDADGRFVMPISNPSVLRMQVSKQGYAQQQLVFDTQPAPPVLEIRLQSAEAGIFGRVLDSHDRPVKWYSISYRSPAAILSGASRGIESDNGEFCLRDLPPGLYSLSFRADDSLIPFTVPEVEIRNGYLYGPVEIRLQPREIKK